MDFQNFKKINTLLGFIVLIIATTVYALTMESSASLWDCGEFISAAYKQQVVHPPGAPLFLMIARIFTLFAGGNEQIIPLTVNFMSALCSGLAMMFLFWITSQIARRILVGYNEDVIPTDKAYIALGAGFVAALTGTFLDSVWFSAVEGEVYAASLMCTALVFWCAMKWEERAEHPYSDRWLLLIAFICGCSIFIHWLNLLCIPAIVMLYYFRRYTPTPRNTLIAFGIAILILGVIYSSITKIVGTAASFELFFVNSLGMPFNSGLIVFIILFLSSIVFGLWYAYKNNKPVLYNVLTAVVLILTGYSTITQAVIRSNAGTNIDMNSPRDIVSLASYLEREQYGSRPFLTGYYYTAPVVGITELGKKYQRGEKKYDVVGEKIEYEFKGKKIFFPRVYDPQHKDNYERWLGKKGEPNYLDNIKFFFQYQIGHMYVRYLLWNFVGRQNDEQGYGDIKDGNWLSGINFIDGLRLGNQSNLPDIVKNHPARNTYYFLPLLLAILGIVYHFTNDKRHALVVLLLFFLCGIAIIIQGNSPPVEPRERDYIFAGSFWAFTIWIGVGVIALYDILKSYMPGTTAAALATFLSLSVPAVMGYQNWDDHNRHGKTTARDFAANYLESCAPNAIIFTQGDNDTYPLWYVQEVENVRRDVRVVNLSLLGVDWYINQLRRKVNDADPVPMTLSQDKIRGSTRDAVPFVEGSEYENANMELSDFIKFIGDDKKTMPLRGGDNTNYYPTKNLSFAVDKEAVLKSGAIANKDIPKVVDKLEWKMNKGSLYKNDLMVLDIINANKWKRPIYFAVSVASSSYMGLQKYFQQEGLAYRLVPVEFESQPPYMGGVNSQILYDNIMKKFKYGHVNNPAVHVDNDSKRMLLTFRNHYARLADALLTEGDTTKAIEVLNRGMEEIPETAAPLDMYMLSTVQAYFDAKAFDKGNALVEKVATNISQDLKYYASLSPEDARIYKRDQDAANGLMGMFRKSAKDYNQPELAKKLDELMK